MKPIEIPVGMVDIHCHLLPGIDDGASTKEISWQMARMAVQDGIRTTIVTPHQLGNFSHNRGEVIRRQTSDFQSQLQSRQIPLRVLPGADVRIEPHLLAAIENGSVLTLGDHRRHILLELPHELYIPISSLLGALRAARIHGILTHPERNQGLLARRELVLQLVDEGCFMQITAGSLTGSMGNGPREFCLWMLDQGLVHFVATDAHGIQSRRPLLSAAYRIVLERTDEVTALDLFVRQPAAIAEGRAVPAGRRRMAPRSESPRRWWSWKRAS